MRLKLKKPRKWLIIATAVLVTATPGFALFGLGDIVFDPTSYGSLVEQLTTLQMQYNKIKNNLTHFSVKQHDRGVGLFFARLPHCRRPVPGGADTERNHCEHAHHRLRQDDADESPARSRAIA